MPQIEQSPIFKSFFHSPITFDDVGLYHLHLRVCLNNPKINRPFRREYLINQFWNIRPHLTQTPVLLLILRSSILTHNFAERAINISISHKKAYNMKATVFWDIASCDLVERAHCLHHLF